MVQAVTPGLASPRPGVGVLYNQALGPVLRDGLNGIDFVEVIPDMLRNDRGIGQVPRFVEIAEQIELLDRIAARRPILVHSIGLSIGSAGLFDLEYLGELARWRARYRCPWHSEHLSFARLPNGEGGDHHAALALPVPYDHDVLEMIATRVRQVMVKVPAPFLLENNVYFTAIPEQDMSEPAFLNRLAGATGCGLLLDVHNLHANARNHGVDTAAFLAELELERVIEVHIAGGSELEGVYIDSHAGPCPAEVWALLAEVAARAPNLAAVTFEFDESYFPLLGADGVRTELDRARAVLAAFR